MVLTGIDVTVDDVAQEATTRIGAIGGYTVVVSTSLPQLRIMLTSSYLGEMIGDIAASHLFCVPGCPPIIDQHVLPGRQPGRTHARACLLDHVAELRDTLDAYHKTAATVTVTIADSALTDAQRAWQAQHDPPAP